MKNVSEKTMLAIIMALVLIFGLIISNKVDTSISNLSNKVQNLSNTVNNQNQQISNLYARIENLLESQTSIIDSYDIKYGAFNGDDLTYEVLFTVTPKEGGENIKATVSLDDVKSEMNRIGNSFAASVKVPVAKEYQPTITFLENNISRNETLKDTLSFRQNYLMQIKSGFSGEKSYNNGNLNYKGNVIIYFGLPTEMGVESGRFLALLNKKELWTKGFSFSNQKENDIEFNEIFAVNSGDEFILYIEVKDTNGITYRYPIDSIYVSPDGRKQSEHFAGNECIIIDKNGNEIKFE
ncbi:hypothetical protein OXPF_10110 [Oxobacter pfennigii]|uniref:Uncharacterized protein n=1 Tax=Oxobacter pfennigii TaxID=36849 RepID=A0A0N8NTU1_9CLOT|nr:hypothetical protein [Oxobacter pfennigii]KPU45776.1 hypothetical protein OXPF_10110 [Oxobacter pfennigii]